MIFRVFNSSRKKIQKGLPTSPKQRISRFQNPDLAASTLPNWLFRNLLLSLERPRELKSSYYTNGLTSLQGSCLAQQDQDVQHDPFTSRQTMASGFLPLLADPSIPFHQAFSTHLWIPSPPLLLQAHWNLPCEMGCVDYFTIPILFK